MMWDTSKLESVNDALRLLIEVFRKDSSLLICGNGGSASDSQHIVGELQKSFLLPRTLVDDDKKMFDLTDEDYKFKQACVWAKSLFTNFGIFAFIRYK